MKKPELLCPVGGADTLRAALMGGADAVYFGGTEFNARMNAKNFERDAICRAIASCHEKGVRVYLTLNTLLTDRELPRAVEFASFLYEKGCDALILADAGLAKLLHDQIPDFELHASTQMSGHNTEAAVRLSEMGFSRMVCAREVDRKNLKRLCASSPIEIEYFVHGALCASHSGQCLMSSMIGERSGNRGECAQPCRLPFNKSYPICLKDLSLAGHVPELIQSGVASLKIEGRMKSSEYVYTAASIWRRLLDENRAATEREMQILSGAFSRSGFTDGYYVKKLSGDMLGRRTEQDKEKSRSTKIPFRESTRKAAPIVIRRVAPSVEVPPLPPKEPLSKLCTARFYRPETIPQNHPFDRIYLPLSRFDPRLASGVFLPPAVFDDEKSAVRAMLEKAAQEGAKHVLLQGLGQTDLIEGLPLIPHADFRFNLTNSFSLQAVRDLSLEGAIVSPELKLAQLRDLRGEKSVIIYGRIPLMLLEKRVGAKSLTDRRGAVFPILGEFGRDVVFNSVPFYMLDKKRELAEKGLFRTHCLFTTESAEEVKRILQAIQCESAPQGAVRRIK